MTCRNQCVDAYSAAHDIVANSVHEWVRCFSFRELHVSVVNRSQSSVEKKFVVEKV